MMKSMKTLRRLSTLPKTAVKAGFEEPKIIKQAGRPIYLDFQATTPMDFRVLDAMLPYMTFEFGNPHSRTHSYGWESEKAVEVARNVRHY